MTSKQKYYVTKGRMTNDMKYTYSYSSDGVKRMWLADRVHIHYKEHHLITTSIMCFCFIMKIYVGPLDHFTFMIKHVGIQLYLVLVVKTYEITHSKDFWCIFLEYTIYYLKLWQKWTSILKKTVTNRISLNTRCCFQVSDVCSLCIYCTLLLVTTLLNTPD